MKNNYEITQSCLWYNTKLYFPDWYKHNIYLVGDVIDPEGNILSFEDITEKYNSKPNILDYYRLRKLFLLISIKIGTLFCTQGLRIHCT